MHAGARAGARAVQRRKKFKRLGAMEHSKLSIRERNPSLAKEGKDVKGLSPEE